MTDLAPSWRLRLSDLQSKRGRKALAAWAGQTVLIYSSEWGAWWRPNGAGYTSDLEQAGRYLFEDAYGLTCHCGSEKQIEYHQDFAI